MLELPDFAPLKTTQSNKPLGVDSLDQLLIVVGKKPADSDLASVPQGRELARALARAGRNGQRVACSRLRNARGTGAAMTTFSESSTFAALSWAAKTLRESLRDRPATLGIVFAGLDAAAEERAADALLAAAHAAAFALPTFKSKREPARRLRTLRVFARHHRLDFAAAHARALGNNVARWFTALPPNVLTAGEYRRAVERLAKAHGIAARFFGESALRSLGAGAFLAVSRGNAARDAGILRLRYRPQGAEHRPALALVGKGVLFDTGGTNLKPFKGMLDMHTDMQGSAVALGTLLGLVALRVPYSVDAWLALTENRLAPNAYKPQDLVTALNGTTIQVIHTDAEGRMILADTLALAARDDPELMLDYATLTGACVMALTERYSGAFSNRRAANLPLIAAGEASGERVWPFPMDDDFDEALKSEIADVKQCSAENDGDHILAARFLSRFVPHSIPWIHFDLSAGQRKGGLAHVPSEITGFGVRLSLELLQHQFAGPRALAERLAR